MAAMAGNITSKSVVSGDELKAFREGYKFIPNLQPGEKVRWKKGQRDSKYPGGGEVVEVLSVLYPHILPTGEKSGSNHACDEKDFTFLLKDNDDGELQVYAFDSRKFERVTD